ADLAFFQANPTGTLISRFVYDVNMLRTTTTNILSGLTKELFTAIGLMALISRRMRRASRNTQSEVGTLTTLLDQVFQGIRHVKAYGMEAYEQKRADMIVERLFKLIKKVQRVRSVPSPIMEAMGGVAVACVILYGGHQVVIGARTPGTFFSFITALLLAYQPLKVLAALNVGLQEGLAAAQRVFTVLDMEPQIRDRPGAHVLNVKGGEVRFAGVG